MQNNIFLGATDPLLGGNAILQNRSIDDELARLQAMQQQLEQKRMEIAQARNNIENPASSTTPVWDEIDKIVSEMSEAELSFITQSEDFKRSNQDVMNILQREQLRMMRPVVERCKDGKEALERHLSLVKRLKKESANESEKAMLLFKEYTEHYADMPYADFIRMKKGGHTDNANQEER